MQITLENPAHEKGKLPWRIGTKVSQLPQPSMCTIYDAGNNPVAVAETRALAVRIVEAINAWKPGTQTIEGQA